jgi:hypothetical protein
LHAVNAPEVAVANVRAAMVWELSELSVVVAPFVQLPQIKPPCSWWMDMLAGASESNCLKGKNLTDVLAYKCVSVSKEYTKVQEKRA